MREVRVQILSISEIRDIHNTTLDVMENVGLVIEDAAAREIFKNEGCTIDGNLVKIPRGLVESCINKTPRRFTFHGRDPKNNVTMVGDGSITNYINLGIGTRAVRYLGNGKYDIHPNTLKDTGDFFRVLDACKNMSWATLPASAMDLMDVKCVRTLHEVYCAMVNTSKPFLPDPDHRYIGTYFEMMKATYSGDEEEAMKKPFLIIGGTTTSPLQLDTATSRKIINGCKYGFPIMAMTMEMAAATSPIYLAGTLVLHNCEALACVVLAQLCRAGTNVIYGTATTAFDLNCSTAPFGSPEAALLSAALAQIAQYYGIPSITTGGGSDSCHIDVQAGHESTLTGLLTALSGSNNVFGSGLVELGMAQCPEMLVLRDEMISKELRILEGIEVNETTLSYDIIRNAGPGGDFIGNMETIDNMMSLSQTSVFNRKMYDEWCGEGALDALENAHAKVNDLLENYQPTPIDAQARKEIEAIIKDADKREGATQVPDPFIQF